MNLDQLQARRNDILLLASAQGTSGVGVFGSVATGQADEASGVDLLVDLAAGRSLFDLGALLMDRQALLGRAADVVTEPGLRSRVRERVLVEAVTL